MKNSLLVIVAAVTVFATPSMAQEQPGNRSYEDLQPGDPILEDHYVKLYLFRVERRRTMVSQQAEEVKLAKQILARRELLFERNATSREDVEISRRDTEVHALRLEEYKQALKEAEVLLDIAVDRVSIGLEMPICVEMQ